MQIAYNVSLLRIYTPSKICRTIKNTLTNSNFFNYNTCTLMGSLFQLTHELIKKMEGLS